MSTAHSNINVCQTKCPTKPFGMIYELVESSVHKSSRMSITDHLLPEYEVFFSILQKNTSK